MVGVTGGETLFTPLLVNCAYQASTSSTKMQYAQSLDWHFHDQYLLDLHFHIQEVQEKHLLQASLK